MSIDKNNFVVGIDFVNSIGDRVTNVSYCEYLPEGFRAVADIRFKNGEIDRHAFIPKFSGEERMEIINIANELLDLSTPLEFK